MGMTIRFFVTDQSDGCYFEKSKQAFLMRKNTSKLSIRKTVLMPYLMTPCCESCSAYSIH